MVNRSGSDSGSGSGEDEPRFDWLYGKNRGQETGPIQQPAPNQPRALEHPEATKVLPTQPAPGTSSSSSGTPPRSTARPTPPQIAPEPGTAPAGPRRPRGSRFRRPTFWLKLLPLLLVLWLVYLIAVPMITWGRVESIPFEPDGERPDDQPGTTYLMIGSDSRAGLSKEEREKFNTGNPESSLADTIMLLHTGSDDDVLLSFPRDWTPDGSKINGYYDPGDPTELVAVIEQQTGIRIDDYVEIGLGGVAGVVDAVGGIEICPKENMDDKLAGLKVKKGCQEADGETALAYSRARHSGAGDLDRVGRQREVVAAIGSKVLSPWTFINPVRWWQLNAAVPDFFAFGESTGRFDAGKWALAMSSIGEGRTCTMPVTDGSATTMDEDRARPLFDAIIEDHTGDITDDQCTATGLPTP